MARPKQIAATHSNAGLRALQALLEPDAALALAEPATIAGDVHGVTDAIAVSLDPTRPEAHASARSAVRDLLGDDWEYRDDEVPGGRPTRTALPPPAHVPSIAQGWELARRIEGLNHPGIVAADLLVAQVAPETFAPPETRALAAAPPAPDWHLDFLHVSEAWSRFPTGGPGPGAGVKVAVLDTGYTQHPEILLSLARRPGQPNAFDGIDLLDGNDPLDPLLLAFPLTTPSHGTAVMSVVASPEGNQSNAACAAVGVTGIAPFATLLPVRVTTHVVLIAPNKLAPAIVAAVDAGADVLNIALGAPLGWAALEDALAYAQSRGVIVVAASGNYWPAVVYPAAYPTPVAAAACDSSAQPWRWAGKGDAVDIVAPGVDVHRATSEREAGRVRYCTGPSTGTTFATACCSGLAALWLAHHGGRAALVSHYGHEAARVPQAFHSLIKRTAEPALPASALLGAGFARADRLLDAPLPAAVLLDEEQRERQLQLAPASPATDLFAIAQAASAAPVASARATEVLRMLLPIEPDDRLFGLLVRELQFQVASRPALAPMLGRLLDTLESDEVRAALLASEHLSPTLRALLAGAHAGAGEAVAGALAAPAPAALPAVRRPPAPRERRLQVYSTDPSLASELRSIDYDRLVVSVRWEPLLPGPVGEYLEVIDVDPASQAAYAPVDLEDAHLLGANGLAPDEADPQFHQQMVYSVAMKTIGHFERALGRPAFWASAPYRDETGRWLPEAFVPRLRLFPHAMRARNAYYSPARHALLFGYFRVPLMPSSAPESGPATTVFTALSYDIIAHETSHALLDGMYRHYTRPTNPDVFAFHEAFADLVALFQHFTHAPLLRAAIDEAQGNLEAESLLGQLARQFGRATGQRGALRDAIGTVVDGRWQRRTPDPTLLHGEGYRTEPHQRGSILVAAVFDAFLSIYRRRAQPLLRLATSGSGVLPPGAIPPDLAAALGDVAARSAEHALSICIRALDYLPPIDLTFGDYLRALITADRDVVPDDDRGYRAAFAEAFRSWGIYPSGVTTVAPDSLRWEDPDEAIRDYVLPQSLCDLLTRAFNDWRLTRNRAALHTDTLRAKAIFNTTLRQAGNPSLGPEIGIDLDRPFEVHTLRAGNSVGPDGDTNPRIVVTLTQRRQTAASGDDLLVGRTGSTLLFDLVGGRLRYVIHQRDRSGQEAESRRRFLDEARQAAPDPYGLADPGDEPFAALHLAGR